MELYGINEWTSQAPQRDVAARRESLGYRRIEECPKPEPRLDRSSLHFGNVGSGNRHLADYGQLHHISRLSLHRAPVAGRPRFIRRRQHCAGKVSRNIFAALSVPRRTSKYFLGADRSFLRTIIFRRHVGRHKYYKGDDDCAPLGNTWLQHEPAYHSPLFLARWRWTQCGGAE